MHFVRSTPLPSAPVEHMDLKRRSCLKVMLHGTIRNDDF